MEHVGSNVSGSKSDLAVVGTVALELLWELLLVKKSSGLAWIIPLLQSRMCWCRVVPTLDTSRTPLHLFGRLPDDM